MAEKDEAKAVRMRRALLIARKATSLQIAVAGQTNLGVTEQALDGVAICSEIIERAERLKGELERLEA